ncbi:MAG: glycosyltransferase [Armatimonadetes bacterium]|nr:glycosyltransferase [Armatimonadota bacterium]
MTNSPLVSIVLPTYNGSRYLDQAIQSILNQTYSNWELIIVDDGSNDDTPNIISRYVAIDSRIRSIRHPINRKLPAALNTGFAQAKGEFLTWTSNDNCYRPNALAIMVSFLEAHPDVGIVYTDYSVIDEGGNVIDYREAKPFTEIVRRNCIGPSFLYRRQVQEKVGPYSEELFLSEDYDFWLRAAAAGFKFHPLNVDVYCYRRHGESLSANRRDRGKVSDRALARNVWKIRWLDNFTKAQIYFNLARRARYRRDLIAMCKCLAVATLYDPRIILSVLKVMIK